VRALLKPRSALREPRLASRIVAMKAAAGDAGPHFAAASLGNSGSSLIEQVVRQPCQVRQPGVKVMDAEMDSIVGRRSNLLGPSVPPWIRNP
jgi:hypothetical protein